MSSKYNRKDHLYQKAKDEGYRSRAAYKLKELNAKYGLIKPGAKVLDVGAWPGGWLQVAAESVGQSGLVLGVDLQKIEPFPLPQIRLFTGNAQDETIVSQIRIALEGNCDALLSDMSPKLSGIKELDRSASLACAELALSLAHLFLREGGAMVCKVFKSNETETFVKSLRTLFNKLVRAELDSSRSTSNEFYIIAFGFRRG